MSIRGAGFAGIQFNDICNYVWIDGQRVYEPLIHEWLHNLDWALYEINGVPDEYQYVGPDWATWQHGSWPACGEGDPDPLAWFPSVDLCEWDPDWQDCNNAASAGICLHAGEVDGGSRGMSTCCLPITRGICSTWAIIAGMGCRTSANPGSIPAGRVNEFAFFNTDCTENTEKHG